jgi:hypothetical protein
MMSAPLYIIELTIIRNKMQSAEDTQVSQVSATNVYVNDPVYTAFQEPAAIDKDTRIRKGNFIPAVIGGSGSVASPLNGPNAQRTTFEITTTGSNRIRWDTLGVRIGMVFTKLDSSAAAAPSTAATDVLNKVISQPYNSPSWNMTFALISGVTLKFNGVTVYDSAHDSSYVSEVTARLLRYYSYETLNSMANVLFTPIGSTEYCIGSARDDTVIAPTKTTGPYHIIKPATYDSVSCPYFDISPTEPAVLADTVAGFTPEYNPNAKDALLKERAKLWCSGDTDTVLITKIVPLSILTPIIKRGIIQNLQKIVLDITWSNSLDHLEHTSIRADEASTIAANGTTWGGVRVVSCDMVTDCYTPSSGQFGETLTSKVQGRSDIIEFHNTTVSSVLYTDGADITIPSKKNLQCVMVLQPARGFVNGLGATGAALGVGKRMYQSYGEFLTFGNSNNTTGAMKHSAAESDLDAYSRPISSIVLEIGGEYFPQSPITISKSVVAGTSAADYATLYQEYLKTIGKIARRDIAPAIPYSMFCTTMPFVCISPCADNGSSLSTEGKSVVLKITGGTSNTSPSNVIHVVCFEFKAYRITPDGQCNLIGS